MNAGSGMNAVSVRDLTRAFGDFVAVDHVTFDVPVGSIFGFLGPNGAGKTTTIKMLAGLIPPTSGAASVAGHDVRTESAAVKRSIGYMSQLFSLYADLTVEENISLFAGLYGVTGQRLDSRRRWILEMAGLESHQHRITGELSQGWKQRLALGCAVLHEPPVLFLDEPTSGVDPVSRRSFWDLIYELAEGGTTVFVSTHYMEEAEYCYQLALMNRGRLIALDRPTTLKATLGLPLLELHTEHPAQAVEVLRSTPGVIEAAMFGRDVHLLVENVDDVEPIIQERLLAAGLAGTAEAVSPSLEDVFVALIRREGGAPEG
jgi:drug efflux transport system ATP-binding protein